MEKDQKMVALMSTALLLLILSAAASPETVYTPLYMVRMEQTSDDMNFLPTEMSGFTYETEKGCTVNCSVKGMCGNVDALTVYTCYDTCHRTCRTCFPPCAYNVDAYTVYTCYDTCHHTCRTCFPPC